MYILSDQAHEALMALVVDLYGGQDSAEAADALSAILKGLQRSTLPEDGVLFHYNGRRLTLVQGQLRFHALADHVMMPLRHMELFRELLQPAERLYPDSRLTDEE